MVVRKAYTNEYDPACITFNSSVERNKYEADNFSSVQHGAACYSFDTFDKDKIRTINSDELTLIVLHISNNFN